MVEQLKYRWREWQARHRIYNADLQMRRFPSTTARLAYARAQAELINVRSRKP